LDATAVQHPQLADLTMNYLIEAMEASDLTGIIPSRDAMEVEVIIPAIVQAIAAAARRA
jgi:hypothetical protein